VSNVLDRSIQFVDLMDNKHCEYDLKKSEGPMSQDSAGPRADQSL
jgi:hypothetical protein